MIQEIVPKKLNNQYINFKPSENDSILIFQGSEVVVFVNEDHNSYEEKHITLPKRIDLLWADDGKFQYLFKINEVKYFLFKDGCPGELENYLQNVKKIRQKRDKDVVFAIATGYHLQVWYRDNKFCGRCGSVLEHSSNERMLHCPECGNMVYPKIAPAVIVGVTNGNRLLLTKYAGNRAYKKYALVAGFTEIGETPEETVEREVMEEVGLKVKNIRYFKSQPWGTDSNLLLGYFCDVDGSDDIVLDHSELSVGEWFEREDIPMKDDDISLTLNMVQAFKEGREK